MKLKISSLEKVVYKEEVIVKAPEGMTDEEFKHIVKSVEAKSADLKDMAHILNKEYGFEVSGEVDRSVLPPSPLSSEPFKINMIDQV